MSAFRQCLTRGGGPSPPSIESRQRAYCCDLRIQFTNWVGHYSFFFLDHKSRPIAAASKDGTLNREKSRPSLAIIPFDGNISLLRGEGRKEGRKEGRVLLDFSRPEIRGWKRYETIPKGGGGGGGTRNRRDVQSGPVFLVPRQQYNSPESNLRIGTAACLSLRRMQTSLDDEENGSRIARRGIVARRAVQTKNIHL